MECMKSCTVIYDDSLGATELSLAPPGSDHQPKKSMVGAKRTHDEVCREYSAKTESSETSRPAKDNNQESAPVAKAQVVGWPPVRAYRKNNTFQAKKSTSSEMGGVGLYVKVSMDGAPYLRKIDLKMYKGYRELRDALNVMFNCFSVSKTDGCKDGGGDNEFAVAYEDKDGDLMLVGDVPWEMFTSSCKKLRIMRGAEARGLEQN